MRTPLVAAIAAASLLSTAPCFADDQVVDNPRRGLQGFELMLRPGFGGAPSDSPLRLAPGATLPGGSSLLSGAAPYSPGLVANGTVGYRFHPLFSAGLRLGIRQAGGDGQVRIRSAFDYGAYFRAYPLATTPSISRYVDPWISFGIGQARDNQSIKQGNRTESLDHFAISVPIGIGIDWRVLPNLSIGPSLEYALALGTSGCQTVLVDGAQTSQVCTGDTSKVLEARNYGVWSGGLDMRITF